MVKRPDQQDGELQRRAKALFEQSVERLDARTRSRLTQARHAALDEIRQGGRPWFGWHGFGWHGFGRHEFGRHEFGRHGFSMRAPAGALLAATLAAVFIGRWLGGGSTPAQPAELPLEDFEIVADAGNIEMLQEVEFYAWLETAAQPRDQ